jgi:hypothetical protein
MRNKMTQKHSAKAICKAWALIKSVRRNRMYVVVDEDFEHRVTQQMAFVVALLLLIAH